MTVGELIRLLGEFPPELPVYFAPDAATERVIAPADAIIDRVDQDKGRVLADRDPHRTIPPGYGAALVIHASLVRNSNAAPAG
jgi:hypothetical protein